MDKKADQKIEWTALGIGFVFSAIYVGSMVLFPFAWAIGNLVLFPLACYAQHRIKKEKQHKRFYEYTRIMDKAEAKSAEEYLNSLDIWHHPIIANRAQSKGYEVAELMELYASQAVEKYRDTVHVFHEHMTKLQDFKDYVHKRLDDAGIPVDPESPHKAAGCRIGGRLDIALGAVERYKDELNVIAELIRKMHKPEYATFFIGGELERVDGYELAELIKSGKLLDTTGANDKWYEQPTSAG